MRVLIRVDNAGVHRVYLCLKTTAGGFCLGGGLTTRAHAQPCPEDSKIISTTDPQKTAPHQVGGSTTVSSGIVASALPAWLILKACSFSETCCM